MDYFIILCTPINAYKSISCIVLAEHLLVACSQLTAARNIQTSMSIASQRLLHVSHRSVQGVLSFPSLLPTDVIVLLRIAASALVCRTYSLKIVCYVFQAE